ncbi:cytochrome-c peroxidase [Blastopirellula marina]|uniref:Cytochrome-c peroxidase n=1 Tax=Blastopirellula marina DSM 3645 TaxID=314230 RepID=A3ZST1_9BACT|nr:cytochrome c peroxidase [Blastopirellula marina]EAQ80355.1 cytochrome-c peroxidase [Blastopirellula marina DSM 3645]
MKRHLSSALLIALVAYGAGLFAEEPAAKSNKVTLGDPALTAGIPGEGPIEVETLKKWLADPANHEPLEVELPYGIAAQAGNITGLDKNPMTRAKIELGRQLYFDKRLSIDQTISCADCHHPDSGWAKETQFGVGVLGQQGNRNSPVSFNRILSGPQFWDGRAPTLEDQAIGPIANPIEMGHTHDACVLCLDEVPGYKLQFKNIFGEDKITIDSVGKALATFERAIVTGPAPYDYYEVQRNFENQLGEDIEYLEEDDPDLFKKYAAAVAGAKPMSESARRGREIFFSEKGKCTACHAGANFTDEQYHNLGVGMDAEQPDLGRYEVTKEEKDKGAFKTPTLRNIAQTGPYMHDGSQKTLMEVVEWYAKGGHPNPYLSDKVKKLDLTQQDKEDLVAFMEALTGEFPAVETERLPK